MKRLLVLLLLLVYVGFFFTCYNKNGNKKSVNIPEIRYVQNKGRRYDVNERTAERLKKDNRSSDANIVVITNDVPDKDRR